jgi:hypothetical protein
VVADEHTTAGLIEALVRVAAGKPPGVAGA